MTASMQSDRAECGSLCVRPDGAARSGLGSIVRCWVLSKGMFSIRPTLSFVPTAFAGFNPDMARMVVAKVST